MLCFPSESLRARWWMAGSLQGTTKYREKVAQGEAHHQHRDPKGKIGMSFMPKPDHTVDRQDPLIELGLLTNQDAGRPIDCFCGLGESPRYAKWIPHGRTNHALYRGFFRTSVSWDVYNCRQLRNPLRVRTERRYGEWRRYGDRLSRRRPSPECLLASLAPHSGSSHVSEHKAAGP